MKQEMFKDFSIDFPILKNVTYLDNGATSLTPECVVEAMNDYYRKFNANIHRSIHKLGEKATEEYEKSRVKIASFINARPSEIVFTKGTTESLNLLAYSLSKDLKEGDEIVLSKMEHHSNLVPWQQIAKEKNLKLKYFEDDIDDVITDKTKIVSVTHVSNVLGRMNDIKLIAEKAHEKNALVIVDSAQGVPHVKIDVEELDVDFLAFSGHKMLGPTGVGVLYGKYKLLRKMKPFMYGGEMISSVSFKNTEWNEVPHKFEAGTPNIAGVIGLGRAIEYLEEIGMDNIEESSKELAKYAYEKLKDIENVEIYSDEDSNSLISFNLKGIHAHDVAAILDKQNIAVRAGHMCAMPLIKEVLKQQSVVRASFYFYNTKDDVDLLVEGIKKVKGVFA